MADTRWSNITRTLSRLSLKQKLQYGAGVVGLGVLVTAFASGALTPSLESKMKNIAAPAAQPKDIKGISVGQDATFMGKVAQGHMKQDKNAAEIKALKQANIDLRDRLQRSLNAPPKKPDVSKAEVQRMIQSQLVAARSALNAQNTVSSPPAPPPLVNKFVPPSAPPGLSHQPVGKQAVPPNPVAKSASPSPVHAVAIAAGSYADGIALNGFLAQSTGEPESVTIELTSEMYGPSDSRIPMQGCRIVTECDAKDLIARGRCEISVVTCTLPSNRLVDIAVSGWIAGEDNVNGSFGTVIWNDNELLKRMGQAVVPGIISKLLKLTDTTITASSGAGVVTSGTTSPLGDIARDLSELLLDRVRMFIFPIVYVDRSQRVSVYIRETAYVTGTMPRDWVPSPSVSLTPYN